MPCQNSGWQSAGEHADVGATTGRARYLSVDLDAVYAEHFPRKVARLAAEAADRGDQAHADMIRTVLISLNFCGNCGRPVTDPVSVRRGIESECCGEIDPGWRETIRQRLAGPADVRAGETSSGQLVLAGN